MSLTFPWGAAWTSAHGHEASVVFKSFRVFDIRLEMGEAPWIGKTGRAQQLEVTRDREASGLIVPCRAIRLDEVAVDQQAAVGKRRMTSRVHIGDGPLAPQ